MHTDTQTQSTVAARLSEIHCLIKDFELAAEDNPRHPTMRLALQLAKRLRLEGGDEALTHDDLEELVDEIDIDATFSRAQYGANYMGDMNIDNNIAASEAEFEKLARRPDGTLKPFAEFIKDTTGMHEVVVTGHPVFGMHRKKAQAIANHAAALAGDTTQPANTAELLMQAVPLTSEEAPTLNGETDQGHGALRNGHAAGSMLERAQIRVAKRLYPTEWMNGIYNPYRLGTWLKLDRDGRKDVTEFDSLSEYLELQVMMFDDHIERFVELSSKLSRAQQKSVQRIIRSFSETRNNLMYHRDAFAAYNKNSDAPKFKKLSALAAKFVVDGPKRVKHPGEAIAGLEALKGKATDDALEDIVHLVSRLTGHGLAYAHAQFRVSSNSVSAAVKEQTDNKINIEDESFDDGNFTHALDDLIMQAVPQRTNLIHVAQSEQTLMTQMMLIRQIRDETDQYTPIHFLTAETHLASIVLGTVYAAKLTGVDKHVLVIPLLEDRMGTEGGRTIMEILLGVDSQNGQDQEDEQDQEKPIRSYLEHALGERPHNPRQCYIGTEHGYSDLQKGDGRSAASAFQEESKSHIVRLISKKVPGARILMFDTQGQEMGRNQNFLSMEGHHANLNSAYFLDTVRKAGVHITLQKSVQGQDGFMLEMGTPSAALRNMVLGIRNRTRDTSKAANDVFYRQPQRAKAFHKVAREAHAKSVADPDYARLISTASGALPIAGSRPNKGTYDGNRAPPLPRAIRTNGTQRSLQFRANIINGLGSAVARNEPLYKKWVTSSGVYRKQHLPFTMAAMERSDPGITRSFIELYNPAFWIDRAKTKTDTDQAHACFYIAAYLEKADFYRGFSRQVNVMSKELHHIQKVHKELKLDEDKSLDHPNLRPSLTEHYNTQALHAIKLAAMIDMLERVAQIPEIAAERNGINKADLMGRAFNFEKSAIALIGKIYQSTEHDVKIPFPEKESTVTFTTSYAGVAEDITAPSQHDIRLMHAAALSLQGYSRSVG